MARSASLSLVIGSAALGFLLAGCGGPSDSNGASAGATASPIAASPIAAAPTAELASASGVASRDATRRIIRTATVSIVTEDLDRTEIALGDLLRRFSGVIGDASITGARGTTRSASWTVRMPTTALDPFLRGATTLGEVQSSVRTGQDVTAEFTDTDARLRNKRVEEGRLLALLRRGGTELDAVLRVERELSRVRGEIESLQGSLRLMKNQTDLATVTIEARESKTFRPAGPPTLGTRVARAWSESLASLREFGASLLIVLVAMAPWGAILLLGAGLVVLIRRRRGRSRPS